MMATYQPGRSAPMPGRTIDTHRLLAQAAHIAAVCLGALAMLIVFTGLALAAAPGGSDHATTAPPTTQNTKTVLIRTPVEVRQCVTDAGVQACLYGITPQVAGIAPEPHPATPHSRAERTATVAVLLAALIGALGLAITFWRHLATSVSATEQSQRPHRRPPGRR